MKKWQSIEVMVVAKPGATEVDLLNFHSNLAIALNELGIGAGEWQVPLPGKVELPAKYSVSRAQGGFTFYMLVYAEPIERSSWQIG